MGSGAAFLLCSVFFLYVSRPASSCLLMSQLRCSNEDGTQFDSSAHLLCGGHLIRCRVDSETQIKFRGSGEWYRVVEENIASGTFVIEDPTITPFLTSVSKAKGCDFMCRFSPPGPLFVPRRLALNNSLPACDSFYCNKSSDVDGLLFPEFPHDSGCMVYDFYYASVENMPLPFDHTAMPPPSPPPPPVLVWELSVKWDPDGNSSDFIVISVGFSPADHRFDPVDSFKHNKTRIKHCSPGNKHRRRVQMLIIGFSTAAGAAILASLLFYMCCRKRNTVKTPSSSTSLSLQTAPLETSLEKDPEGVDSINYPTHVFRYSVLHDATNGFSHLNKLGEGGHGAVYRGTLPDCRVVAIKRLFENSCKRAELFTNEIAILSGLRHPNLVALYGCTSRHSRELLLVYEFIPNGTIADHLHGHRAAEGALSWPLRLRIAVEAATVLAYLHALKPQIIHRDVKTSNILLDGDFRVKVGDFGLSRLFPVSASHVSTVPQGTPGYLDPDYHQCYQLTDKSDVYSFGVVLAELISSKPAIDMSRHRHEINLADMALTKIQNDALEELVDPKLGFETDWEARRTIQLVAELAMRCLQGEREVRPTMEEVLEVLQGVASGLHQAQTGGEVDHVAGGAMGLQKESPRASPYAVMDIWASRMTTPNSGR